jgi:hypothetical protein
MPGALLFSHAPAVEALRAMMTPQDRMFPVVDNRDFTFMQKTAALMGLRSLDDYEPQPPRRYTELFVMMRLGREMRSINDWYYPNSWIPPGFSRRLLDLTAARYLLTVPAADHAVDAMRPPLRLVSEGDGLRVYENAQALPRARYVPRVEVVPDADVLLRRLAFGSDDLHRVALLEAVLPSGFVGVPGNQATGTVDFLLDEPEHVVVRVQAPDRGFLFLADEHYPGWTATVNGVRVPITRADYAFRLVEVPAGVSTVEFQYVPTSLRVGAAVSTLTVLTLVLVAFRGRRSRTE